MTAAHYHAYLDALSHTEFSGEIHTDDASRLTVATDNSIYQVMPEAVLFPRTTTDISIALTLAHTEPFRDICFTARGGGTGTNGQSLSSGIIIDCSKYLTAILEINTQEHFVRVQPGVILDQLNETLRPYGVHFAPEISPSNRATIGGMVNTDACGNGSKRIGRTSDHLLNLTYVMSNGKIQQSTDLPPFHAELTTLLQTHQALIHEKFFRAPRTLCGYNLLKAYQNQLQLQYLLAGSEGTLGIITECKLKLAPLPAFKKLLLIKYATFEDALNAKEITPDIQPLVIETIDDKLIALAREDAIYFAIQEMITDAVAINLVECVSQDEETLLSQVDQLIHNIETSGSATGYYLAKNADEIKLLWNLRKKSVGLISKRQDGKRRPIPFIEDTAVPPQHLPDYIREFKQLLDKHQLVYGMYGHVDAGCVHVRPALDLQNPDDELRLRTLSDSVVALVQKYQGVIWGEHGKGFRSEYGPAFFGDTLFHVLRQIKTWFDPYNQLNPGKIATPLTSTTRLVSIEDHLRGRIDKQIPAELQHDYHSALACNGNGACFNYATQDVMCPSYKVTNNRIHSPKGRAVLIREWLRRLPTLRTHSAKEDFSHAVHNALQGCLGCKACTHQCPLNVSVPDFKAKFLSVYHQRYRRPLRDYVIGYSESIARIQAWLPHLSNFLLRSSFIQYLLKRFLRLQDLPEMHPRVSLAPNHDKPSIILVQDAFTSFYESSVLVSLQQLLTDLGFSVAIAPFFANGKPLHVKGFLSQFERRVRKNTRTLPSLAASCATLIGLDPSITLTYREEYQQIAGKEPLGFKVLLPQEFLMQHLPEKLNITPNTTSYKLISHCTEKVSLVETDRHWQTIFAHFGLTLTPVAAGCCGMAGSYGLECEHNATSRQLFAMDWQTQLNQDTEVLATGFSCRSQTKRILQRPLKHPIEILASLVRNAL